MQTCKQLLVCQEQFVVPDLSRNGQGDVAGSFSSCGGKDNLSMFSILVTQPFAQLRASRTAFFRLALHQIPQIVQVQQNLQHSVRQNLHISPVFEYDSHRKHTFALPFLYIDNAATTLAICATSQEACSPHKSFAVACASLFPSLPGPRAWPPKPFLGSTYALPQRGRGLVSFKALSTYSNNYFTCSTCAGVEVWRQGC